MGSGGSLAGATNAATVFNFEDGTDKILLSGFGFSAGNSPTLSLSSTASTNGLTLGAATGIFQSSTANAAANDVTLYINGTVANTYAVIRVTGVTTLDINDFEFS